MFGTYGKINPPPNNKYTYDIYYTKYYIGIIIVGRLCAIMLNIMLWLKFYESLLYHKNMELCSYE